jgi:Putative peptidoglycan binding domain
MKTSKVLIFLSWLFAATLAAPIVTAAVHGGGFSGAHAFSGPGMGMPGRPGMGMPGRPGMGMPGRPGMGMPVRPGMGMRHDHFDHHHDHFHHHEDEDFIFIGSFGFPWWWGWGWGPWWGWGGGGYPYGYYGYGYPYGYGYGYGSGYGQYGEASHSRVAELQRRLAHAGYYHGSIDGVLGPRTRRAIRAYAADHGQGS